VKDSAHVYSVAYPRIFLVGRIQTFVKVVARITRGQVTYCIICGVCINTLNHPPD